MALSLLVAAGPVWGAPHPHPATPAADAGDAEVACPGDLDGFPLALDEAFAGTPRALANEEGVLVRYTLLCPYHRPNGSSVADITLAWSRYDTDDLDCATVELTSEPAGSGRVQGARDHPSLRARVTYGAESNEVLPAVGDVAAELLARVPLDAARCAGGTDADVDVDGGLGVPRDSSSSGPPVALGVALVAGVATLALIGGLAVRRASRRGVPVGAAAAAIAEPDPGEVVHAAGVGPTAGTVRSHTAGGDERRQAAEALRIAEERQVALESTLSAAGADLAVHRAHAEAVRRLVASVRSEHRRSDCCPSPAGLIALAAAATNLLSASASRAASLVSSEEVAAHSEFMDVLDRAVAAVETGLNDSRFRLWQDRGPTEIRVLTTLERSSRRGATVQRRLVERVVDLGRAHEMAGHDAAWARARLAPQGGRGPAGLTPTSDRRVVDPRRTDPT